MDQNDLLVEPGSIGVPWGVSEMISSPQERLVQTMHLSCIQMD
jgi:hypothetical protein